MIVCVNLVGAGYGWFGVLLEVFVKYYQYHLSGCIECLDVGPIV